MMRKSWFSTDGESSEEESDTRQFLTWRLDQHESHADWTVVVERTEEGHTISKSERYHLHKSILGVGPYKSEYFGALFKQYSDTCVQGKISEEYKLSEVHDCASILTFENRSTSDAVPVLLDYIYSRGLVSDFTTENASAVMSLASYLGAHKLEKAVFDFIVNDCDEDTCISYLRSSDEHHNEMVFQYATAVCAKSFEYLERTNLLSISPALFETVVLSPSLKCVSDELSCKVADYCRAHKGEVTATWLANVTDPKRMPSIFPGEGLFLLHTAQEFQTGTEETIIPQYNSLKQRCISAVSEYWSEFLLDSSGDSADTKLFSCLSTKVKNCVWSAALKVAGEELDLTAKYIKFNATTSPYLEADESSMQYTKRRLESLRRRSLNGTYFCTEEMQSELQNVALQISDFAVR
jgi:hypothetical protein